MTLEQIDFFLMAVRCDTFLEAAENLHIAQSFQTHSSKRKVLSHAIVSYCRPICDTARLG